jgi:hypothetical protein
MLELVLAERGADPRSMTYQGDIVPAADLASEGGATPAAGAVTVQDVERGFLFLAGDMSQATEAAVRVRLP